MVTANSRSVIQICQHKSTSQIDKSVVKKTKRKHSPLEIENALDNSMSHTSYKKSSKRDSELSAHMLTEAQDEAQSFFNEVDESPTVPQVSDVPCSSNGTVADLLGYAMQSKRIRFKRSPIEHTVGKYSQKRPNTLHIVWSEDFSLDLAAAVASNGSNCILCVKKFDPSFLPDVLSFSNTFSLQTAEVNFNSVSEPVYFFNFGEINLSLSGLAFKSYKKIESRIKKSVGPEGMELKNVIKYSKADNSWYNTVIQQLKEDCVVPNKV